MVLSTRFAPIALAIAPCLALGASVPVWPQPSGYDLLDRVRDTYQRQGLRRDGGTLTIKVDGQPTTITQQHFDLTRNHEGGFHLTVEDETQTAWVMWGTPTSTWLFDPRRDQYRAFDQPTTALVAVFGTDALDAMVAAMFTLGRGDLVGPFAAAAVDGPESCPPTSAKTSEPTANLLASQCWILRLMHLDGRVEQALWIDQQTTRVRRVEARVTSAFGPSIEPDRLIVVDHRPGLDDAHGPGLEIAFQPPPTARLVSRWEAAETPVATFGDVITIESATLVARAVTASGHPILGLGPDDFSARVARKPVRVVGVEWVGATGEGDTRIVSASTVVDATQGKPQGRQIVLFVQAGVHSSRIRGHQRTRPFVKDLFASLTPVDRIAVFAFASHLELWHDFSRDRAKVAASLHSAIRFGSRPESTDHQPTAADGPSLAKLVDIDAARKVATPEDALRFLGDTLAKIPGEKDVIFLGFGFGTLRQGLGGVSVKPAYHDATNALLRADATVFSLDVTDAGYHDLEVGMQEVASQTGGTYAKTNTPNNAKRAMERLEGLLRGHYVVTLDLAGALAGSVELDLTSQRGRVLHKALRSTQPSPRVPNRGEG